jgi:hypothetical protein
VVAEAPQVTGLGDSDGRWFVGALVEQVAVDLLLGAQFGDQGVDVVGRVADAVE